MQLNNKVYYFQFYVALWSGKPKCDIWKEKYRSSGEPFCFEAKFSDGKVLARQSRLHGKFSARLAGLRFFDVIAKLIFSVLLRRVEIPANRASPVNRASPPHVIAP